MRLFLPARGALLALSTLGCSPSPVEVCQQMVDQLCERSFECRQDTHTPAFQAVFGLDVEECKARYYANNGCEERTLDEQNCTGINAGEREFHTGTWEECREARAQLTCPSYLAQQEDPAQSPPVCFEVCE